MGNEHSVRFYTTLFYGCQDILKFGTKYTIKTIFEKYFVPVFSTVPRLFYRLMNKLFVIVSFPLDICGDKSKLVTFAASTMFGSTSLLPVIISSTKSVYNSKNRSVMFGLQIQ